MTMNINDLRELRERLEALVDYCPPDDAPARKFVQAEKAALWAREQLDELAPVFALLDELNRLSLRLELLSAADGLAIFS
jgi:peptide subunit release factor 1 (eRF1)